MNDFDTMEQMFADSIIEEPNNEPELMQSDSDMKFEDGPYEEEVVPVEVEEEPVVEAPKVFYGSKRLELSHSVEDEAFKEEFRAYFDEIFQHLDYFEDFVSYVANMKDLKQRATILELSKGSRNNLSKQKELWFTLIKPYSAHKSAIMLQAAANSINSQLEDCINTFSNSVQGWQVQLADPLRKVVAKFNEVIIAINASTESAVDSVKASGEVEIAKVQTVFDKIAQKEVISSKGRIAEGEQKAKALELQLAVLEKKISELETTMKAGIKSGIATERQFALQAFKTSAIDVLGAAADSVLASISLKVIAIGVGCGFGGVWLFAVVAKHFPGIVF